MDGSGHQGASLVFLPFSPSIYLITCRYTWSFHAQCLGCSATVYAGGIGVGIPLNMEMLCLMTFNIK